MSVPFWRKLWSIARTAVGYAPILLVLLVLAAAALAGWDLTPRDPGVRGGAPGAGGPLPGLTAGQLSVFSAGADTFQEVDFVQTPPAGGSAGLGPRFNLDSCAGCHAQPTLGGSSPFVNPQVPVATKLGAHNTIPSFVALNGPVREARFINQRDGTPDGGVHDLFVITGRVDAPGCRIAQENFDNLANISFRIPSPVFGVGLLEAIPDRTLRQNLMQTAFFRGSLGIAGRLNVSGNDGTVTRFGWKAQNKSATIFAGEAYNVEQGVTNRLFTQERDESPGCMFNGTPEDNINFDTGGHDDVTLFAAFMQLLAAPTPAPQNASTSDGFNRFNGIGCGLCHTPMLRTGPSSIAALDNKPVNLYSDLALHNMGPGLADGISQGAAGGDEFRTAPLWGLGQRIFFLHDGRTSDLLEAIRAHSSAGNRKYPPSEANAVISRFNSLNATQQQNILSFLRSL